MDPSPDPTTSVEQEPLHNLVMRMVNETIGDARHTAGTLLNMASDEDAPLIADILTKIGQMQANIITSPDNQHVPEWQQNVAHLHNALKNLAAKYARIAQKEIREFVRGVIARLGAFLGAFVTKLLPA